MIIPQHVLAPLNVDRGVDEGAEGDTVAAFPALPCGLDMSLAGDLENHVDR